MQQPRRGALARAAAWIALPALLAAGLPTTASAQSEAAARDAVARAKPRDFPNQPIDLTVVYPAGGGMDINARLVGKYFEKYTDQKAIVNNRTGGAGLVGHTWLATQAKNDGHTVGIVASLLFGDAMLRAQGKWALSDLEPIAYLNGDGVLLVTNVDGPFKDRSMKDILDTAKAKPNTIRITTVPGTLYEYMIDQMEQVTGARFLRVPFQGGAPGIAALMGNNVDLAIGFYGEVRGQLEGKKVVPIAVSTAERSPFASGTPTLAEVTGNKDFVWTIARWAAVPKGTPADRKAWLAAAIAAAVRDPEMQEEFRKIGVVPNLRIATAEQTAAEVARLAEQERAFYVATGRLK